MEKESRKNEKQQIKENSSVIDAFFEMLGLETTSPDQIPMPQVPRRKTLPVEMAEQTGRMVTIALACYGNREMAFAAIDRVFAEWQASQQRVTLDTSVGQIFRIKIRNSLEKGGVHTVRVLTEFSADQLVRIANINLNTAIEIDSLLQQHGFGLRKTLD